jgi:hypothetical protein
MKITEDLTFDITLIQHNIIMAMSGKVLVANIYETWGEKTKRSHGEHRKHPKIRIGNKNYPRETFDKVHSMGFIINSCISVESGEYRFALSGLGKLYVRSVQKTRLHTNGYCIRFEVTEKGAKAMDVRYANG